jgi:hypothetical protein
MMNTLDIRAVFCEVVSGLAFLGLLTPILELCTDQSLSSIIAIARDNFTLGNIAAILILAYLIGIIMDAIGFSLGELFLDRLACPQEPADKNFDTFLVRTPPHILRYRDIQWEYFSCYRNLFILTFPNAILWSIAAWRLYQSVWIVLIILAVSFLLAVVLFQAMGGLIRLYYGITSIYSREVQLPQP